ncbi:MAG: hypothetical protein OIF32_03760 [Campylobacterales bacterium]|nr:hypothetical protein [Campylobacterales bacterium]
MKKELILETIENIIDFVPDLHIGYFGKNPSLIGLLEVLSTKKEFTYTVSMADEFGSLEFEPRSYEYIIVEDMRSLKNPIGDAYNSLESVGLAIFIEKNPVDIWQLTEELSEFKLSNPALIEIDNEYSIVTSKKLLSS